MEWHTFFKGKKITLVGLGLLGRGLGDAVFLAEHGAKLTVTDLRDEKTLAPSLAKLKRYKGMRYRLGEHRLEDFRGRDFILKAAGVSLDSSYIAEARKHGIPIEMDASLFAKLMPKGVILVGVTGTRGKSTTAECIYAILKSAKRRVFLGGVVHTATLPFLEKVRAGDVVVLELDSWQLQGFHDAKLSPHVAVFTTFMDDHLVYYKGDRKKYFGDKAAIFRYQKRGDVLVVGEGVAKKIKNQKSKSKMVVVRASNVPKDWRLKLLGEHNRANIACAVAAVRALGISEAVIKRAVEKFRGVPGRLELLRTIKGVKIYNDNNATTPDATIAALRAVRETCRHGVSTDLWTRRVYKSIILIAGGTDKGLNMSKLVAEIPEYCKAVILLEESGTRKIRSKIYDLGFRNKIEVKEKSTLKKCVKEAMRIAKKGDIILFSPAFASFGRWFKNEYDRGEQFVKIVKNLK